MKNFLQSALSTIMSVYMVTVFLTVPYYNWEYAKKNGFFEWLMMGEIVPTFKAVVWPYYAFSKFASTNKTVEPAPQLSASELDVYSKVLQKMQNEALTDADLAEIKGVITSYTKRTGRKISKSEYNSLIGAMKSANDYQYELGTSVLFSWDRKKYTTTNDFDALYKQLQVSGARKEEKLKGDLETIKAAAANQEFLQDNTGQKYEFNRDIILDGIKKNELMKSNIGKFTKVFEEFTN